MIPKLFVTGNELVLDSFRLAKKIIESGWTPDVLIALWRGGTPIAMGVHEYLLYHGIKPYHMVIKCQSYTGIGQRQPVVIEHAGPVLDEIKMSQRVLVVDDILDSGNTARHVLATLRERAEDVRLATLYWKPNESAKDIRPDYFVHKTDRWIVFPHELEGLTPEEISHKNPALHEMMFGKPQ
jgi:hypoxanthine phosphoribosyltransferase